VLNDLQWNGVRRLVRLPDRVLQPQGRLVELPGSGSTYVTDLGPRDAPTLVLLHALACTAMLSWYPVLEELSRRYRVVLFDQRWHGQRVSAPGSTLEDAADDVVAVADALGIETFVPVGYSMGSLVAQLTWQRHHEQVAGLVLCATSSSFRRSNMDRFAMRMTDLAAATTRRRADRAAAVVPKAQLPIEETYRWALSEFRATSPLALGQAVAAISRFDSSSWVGEVDVPTSAVITQRDRVIAPGRQRWIARQIYGCTSYEIDAGHASCVLAADTFKPALLAACASVVGRLS
jgi:3-oxoadipate enol-lactonase